MSQLEETEPLEVGRIIGGLDNQIRRVVDRYTADSGLTGAEGKILYFILSQREGTQLFQRDIERQFSLRRPTATGTLQQLEKKGLITRRSVPQDARLKQILPTGAALEMQAQVVRQLQQFEQAMQAGIPPADLTVFLRVSAQISENLTLAEQHWDSCLSPKKHGREEEQL